jgi:hypothetical protein
MRYFGPKSITLEDVDLNYINNIIGRSHFVIKPKDIPTNEDIKEISQEMMNLLVSIGVDGHLHFLENFLKRDAGPKKLTRDDLLDIYCECDGFFGLSPAELKSSNLDWSHVRDSSSESLSRAAKLLKEKLIKIYNES